jgi:hypothetical protein
MPHTTLKYCANITHTGLNENNRPQLNVKDSQMMRHPSWLKIALTCAAIFFVASGGNPASNKLTTPTAAKTAVCSAPEYHQFDFWLGNWDGFDVDKPTVLVAHNRVSRILRGCVVLEDYRATDGMEGESFSIYDASRKVWHQTWVTTGGKLLVIEGQFHAGEMVMSGSDRTTDGKQRQVRGVWRPVHGSVRETAVTSLDGGKTWQSWFDMIFRPHAP